MDAEYYETEQTKEQFLQCGVRIECDRPNTWRSLKKMPPAGKKGVILLNLPLDISPQNVANYFRKFCGSSSDYISNIMTLHDGTFVLFRDESAAEHALQCKSHNIDGFDVTVLPKMVPECWTNKFLIKASTDIRAKYLKYDLSSAFGLGERHIELKELGERFFIASLADQSVMSQSHGSVIRGVSEVTPLLKTDCLEIRTSKSRVHLSLDEILAAIDNPTITMQRPLDLHSFLLFFSNFEDAEYILENFANTPVKVGNQDIFINRYLPELHGQLEIPNTSATASRSPTFHGDIQKMPRNVNVPTSVSPSSGYAVSRRVPDGLQHCENAERAIELKYNAASSLEENFLVPSDHAAEIFENVASSPERDFMEFSVNDVEIIGIEPNCNKAKLKSFLKNKFNVPIARITRREMKTIVCFHNSTDAGRFRSLFIEGINYQFGQKDYLLELAPALAGYKKITQEEETPTNFVAEIPSFNMSDVDAIHTWYSQPPNLEECGQRGILAIPGKEHPEKVVKYFEDCGSKKGSKIQRVIPMIDGILFTFSDTEAVENSMNVFTSGDDIDSFWLFPKRIPEYFTDRLLMKKTPKSMKEDVQKLTLENCSARRIKPKCIERLGKEESLIQYDDDMSLESLRDIIAKSKQSQTARKLQLSLLPKTDCLEVEMLKGDNVDEVQPILENDGISGGGKVTRFDEISSSNALVYFTDFKDVETISSKFESTSLKFGDAEFIVKPYYHCFGNKHNRRGRPNCIDEYYRKYLRKIAQNEFCFRIEDERVWKFFLLKPKNTEVFKSCMERIANVTVSDVEPFIIFYPFLFGDGRSDSEPTSFESECFKKAEEFISNFASDIHTVNIQKLNEVRKIKVHRYILENYDAMDMEDLLVRWSNNVVEVAGSKCSVKSFVDTVDQVVDVTSKTMTLPEAKYRWLTETKEFDKIKVKFNAKVDAILDHGNFQINFNGSHDQITDMKCDIFTCLEGATEEKLTWSDMRILFLLKNRRALDTVAKIFHERNVKGILHIENNTVSVWVSRSQAQEAVGFLNAYLETDQIALESDAHHDVTMLDNWKEEVRKAESSGSIIVKIEDSAVVVAGFFESVRNTVPILTKFVQANVKRCVILKVRYIKACHLEQFCEKELRTPGLKWYMDHNKQGIALVGTKKVIDKAKRALRPILAKMEIQSHKIDRPAIVEYFLENRMEIELTARTQSRCTILVDKFNWPTKSESLTAAGITSQIPIAISFRFLRVVFVHCLNVWDDSDAVVCLHDRNDHRQGHQLLDEIWVESVADEKSKKFFHILSSDDYTKIYGNITKLMTLAEDLKCTSISIPILTKGQPTDFAATQELVKAFRDFAESRTSSQVVRLVRILIPNVSKFKDVAKSLNETGAIKHDEHTAYQFQETQDSKFSDDESCSSSDEEEEFVRQVKSIAQDMDLSTPSTANTFGSLKVSVRHGDITDDSNDIIVNSIGSSFKLASGGAVSKMIEKKGGSDIQRELSAALMENRIKITNGGKLKCKKILHVDAPGDASHLEGCLVNIFRKANDLAFSSISLPAIGTGNLGISSDVAAQNFASALKIFSSQHYQTKNLKSVDVVIFDKAMIANFKSHLTVGILPPSVPYSASGTRSITLNVVVRQGSITDEKTDMIVNSLGKDFTLSKAGAVSKEILRKGGQDIQKNLSQANGSQIRVTTGGNLFCKYILHAATPTDITKLVDLMVGILNEAENRRIKSLSIPAIGTGGIGFPSNQVAEKLFAGLTKFCSGKSVQYLKDVNFVVFQPNMIQDFEMQLQKMRSAPNPPSPALLPQAVIPQQVGALKVNVRQGDITLETNDMIVNTLGPDFLLQTGGAVSKIILEKGGKSIQEELSKRSCNKIRVTAAGNLHCKKILHLATPKDVEKLKKVVLSALQVADDENCTSMSIPALGTGGIGLSSSEVARVLLGQIAEFSSNLSKYLKVVDIVVFQPSMVIDFQNELDKVKAPTSQKSLDARPKQLSFVKRGKAKEKKLNEKEKDEKSLILDSIRINVCKGKIGRRNCDVIVHNTDRNFDLKRGKGKFPRYIYGSCKNTIKQEIDRSTDEFLRETTCGIPAAAKLFHVVFPTDSNDLKKAIIRVFAEVTRKGYDSVSLTPTKGGKNSSALLDAAIDFNRANSNKLGRLTVNCFGYESKVFKRLYDAVITKGRSLAGAVVQLLEAMPLNLIRLQLCSHDGSTEEAIKQIESKVRSCYHEEHIPCSDIKVVELRRWEDILDIGESYAVKITQSKRNGESLIVVEGIKEKVLAASMAIKDILSKLDAAEKVMKLGNYFWQYLKMDGKTWETFQALDNEALEKKHQGVRNEENEEDQSMFVDGEKRDFEIDIKGMKIVGYRTVDIRREVIEEYPKTWSEMGSKTIMLVELKSSDEEYKMVAEKFLKTKNPKPRTIVSISRVQNKMLHQVFETKKLACKKHCRAKSLTQYLFHGTKPDVVESICQVGFDRIYSGTRVGAKFGKGNYFAVEADYSAKGYAAPDGKQECIMFLAEVITGDFVKGNHEMFKCPPKQWAPHVPYESLVDDENNPTMYVAFHDAGTYPSFVIKFKL